jgi:hypothetical protein
VAGETQFGSGWDEDRMVGSDRDRGDFNRNRRKR